MAQRPTTISKQIEERNILRHLDLRHMSEATLIAIRTDLARHADGRFDLAFIERFITNRVEA